MQDEDRRERRSTSSFLFMVVPYLVDRSLDQFSMDLFISTLALRFRRPPTCCIGVLPSFYPHPFSSTLPSCRTTFLKSATLDVPTVSDTSLSAEADTPPKRSPTRFDRLKQLYKGRTNRYEDSDLEFSYADFEAAVAKTSYSFERNSIVKGV